MRLIFILVPFLLLSACNGPEQFTWNQRMTVTVETPDGPVTGSSVIEVRVAYCEEGCGLAGDVQFGVRHTGEAVVVEVLPGQFLFVLQGAPAGRFFAADPDRFGGSETDISDWLPMMREQTGTATLCPEACPEMLALVEEDRYGLRDVTPETIGELFGDDFAIQEITLEVTRDPVTDGPVREALGWWCALRMEEFADHRPPLRLANDSPRGWDNVSSSRFLSNGLCDGSG